MLVEFETIHCGVDSVHFTIEFRFLFVEFSHVEGHVSNNKTVNDRAHEENINRNDNFHCSSRTYFSNPKQIKGYVQRNHVTFQPWCVIIFIDLRGSKEHEFHIRNPDFLIFDHVVPDATHDMDVHKHHEDEIDNFVTSFCFFTGVKVHNNATNSVQSENF